MAKIGIAIAVALLIGWVTLPQIRASIIALVPFAIVLICPLAMLFGMNKHDEHDLNKENNGSSHRVHNGCGGDNRKKDP